MNSDTVKDRLFDKINALSEAKLNAVLSFVEALEKSGQNDQDFKREKTEEERKAASEKFERLCEKTQALLTDKPITEEEIQAEIDAYRRGE